MVARGGEGGKGRVKKGRGRGEGGEGEWRGMVERGDG